MLIKLMTQNYQKETHEQKNSLAHTKALTVSQAEPLFVESTQ